MKGNPGHPPIETQSIRNTHLTDKRARQHAGLCRYGSGGRFCYRQHQTAVHDPDGDGRLNGKPGLFQPLPADIDPGHGGIHGPVEVGMILVFDDPGIGTLADLEGPGVTNFTFW